MIGMSFARYFQLRPGRCWRATRRAHERGATSANSNCQLPSSMACRSTSVANARASTRSQLDRAVADLRRRNGKLAAEPSAADHEPTREETVPVPLREAEAKQLLIRNVGQYDAPPGPWPELGSSLRGGHAGPPPYDFRKSSYADTRRHVGAFGPPAINRNHIFMRPSELRPLTGRPWRASELRPLMKFAREVWGPAEMCAMFSFYSPPKIPDPTWAAGERMLEPWIGWITYLPAELAGRAKYPAAVEVETLEGGAALVTLCEEPFGKGRRRRPGAAARARGRPASDSDVNVGSAAPYATALIVRPTLSTISSIWASLMISGGVSSMQSPDRRSMIPASWKEYSSAA